MAMATAASMAPVEEKVQPVGVGVRTLRAILFRAEAVGDEDC